MVKAALVGIDEVVTRYTARNPLYSLGGLFSTTLGHHLQNFKIEHLLSFFRSFSCQ